MNLDRKDLRRRLAPLASLILFLMQVCCSSAGTNGNSGGDATPSNTPTAAPTPEDVGDASGPSREPSLVSLSAGAFVVKRPSEWADYESAFNLLDERPRSVWATEKGVTSPQEIVIALPEKTLLKAVEFDNANSEGQFKGCSARDITVDMSDAGESDGFQKIADVSLRDGEDNQRFPVSAQVPGRWVRLTVKNNHGSSDVTELAEFRAYGTQLTHTPSQDVSGTYDNYSIGDMHIRQQGTSVTGCYESRQGLIEGGVENHVFKFTWRENGNAANKEEGTAVMVFAPDGKQVASLWWGGSNTGNYGRLNIGTRKSGEVGSCPQWAGGAEEQLTKDLEEFGRARLYGINFDTDSDRIKDESKPTLDRIVGVLKAKPDWKITIEGHTDSTSTTEHNQQLSERRAASVKSYLQSAGIDPSRLKTVGHGATKPVADNDTELGRAQNRRVELAKQ